MMKMFRQSNIQLLADAIEGDEFNDLTQIGTHGDLDAEFLNFVRSAFKNTPTQRRLEVGPGSGRLVDYDLACGSYLEPSKAMIQRLKEKVGNTCLIEQGVIEYIPFDETFDLICFFNGFFQVRSDYEALLEVNNHLPIGGKFVFNLYTDDSEDIICGRVLGPNNYLRVLKEFGFEPLDVRLDKGWFNVVKRREVTARALRKLQLIAKENGDFTVLNLHPARDYHLL